MRLLLSNDDGYLAPGLSALHAALSDVADITVVAPERDRSAASNSLTLDNPLRAQQMPNGFFRVDGTPTDCVHLGITGLMQPAPDMVVAGINNGPNLGDDVLYSGTVAAATEGRFMGLPAIAVSSASFAPEHLQTAARVARELVERVRTHPIDAGIILNVNVPDCPWSDLAGWKVTRLGHRHKAEPVVKQTDPRGRTIYWVGAPGTERSSGDDTDFHALRNHYVSVTPLQVDLTCHRLLPKLQNWLESA
ncbi:MAG: 5'/3'-nucleotidase SurE [gamma proteobacterium symbiont of Bathyaustriella thionipta]|nr:5'/3'-nucleotidase SurE [gamma proteobacterium symbiont of Bathyaustriella thionipta]